MLPLKKDQDQCSLKESVCTTNKAHYLFVNRLFVYKIYLR